MLPVETLRRSRAAAGFTLIELIVAIAIMAILAGAALPLMRTAIKREKERRLRHALWEMRDAVDRYNNDISAANVRTKIGTEGYPPDLDTLVDGIDINGKRVKWLRRVPEDPMTKSTDWGMRSMQDDPKTESWGGQNVFDVFTKSQDTAMDGTKYSDW